MSLTARCFACGKACETCAMNARLAERAKRAHYKATRVPYPEAARRVGEALAQIAAENAEAWAAETSAHVRRHGYNRRYKSSDLAERIGLSAPVVGHVVRRFAPVVTEAAGPSIEWFIVSGEVQINPKEAK